MSSKVKEKTPYKSFKIPLKTVIKNKELISTIDNLVSNLNDLVISSYQFLRLYILYKYNLNQPIEITSELISYSIKILGISNSKKPLNNQILLQELTYFYENQFKPTVNHVKVNLEHLSHFISNIVVQMMTCISNNCQERFVSHFKRFINETLDVSEGERFKFKNNILKCCSDNISYCDNEKINLWMNTHLNNILPGNIKKSIHYDVKVRPLEYLKGMFYMNYILEGMGKKLFQFFPLRTNIIPSNIMIDTSSLVDYFYKDLNLVNDKSKIMAKINDNKNNVWVNFLLSNHKIFRSTSYQFAYSIQTDGISCSLLFIRKDLKDEKRGSKLLTLPPLPLINDFPKLIEMNESEKVFALNDNVNIIGCDPGKKSLVYMVDSFGNKLQYSAFQRKFESKSYRSEYILKHAKEEHKVSQLESSLSEENSKTVVYAKFQQYLFLKTQLNINTKQFYSHPTFRRLKLRQFIYSKKSEDKFIDRISKTFGKINGVDKTILIAYGDWSKTEQMKNFIPTLGIGLRRLIHKKYYTVTVHEAYTSQRCSTCYTKLEHYNVKSKEIYRLLTCSGCVRSENKKITFKQRDVNGATNIMNLAKYYLRYNDRIPGLCRNYTPVNQNYKSSTMIYHGIKFDSKLK